MQKNLPTPILMIFGWGGDCLAEVVEAYYGFDDKI